MQTNPSLTCPDCGEPLPENSPQGLCPRCLMRGVVEEAQVPGADVSLDEMQRSFPDLEILELVGRGGMGHVYKARQKVVDRVIALKILSPDRLQDPEWIERFTREARALARLNHPHIVQVHDFGTLPEPHLIMEFIDGVNLRQAMQAGGLSAREALVVVPKLCDALHYAHEQGVLHRDIKPENILIDTEGRVKIVDFGLAKLRDESALSFTLTQSGAKLGTLAYMAPEQIEKPAEVDHRADIYSLGVVFYEMLTGELPLGRFPAPSEAGGTDPRLDGVVLKTLEKNKEKRFQDAGAMKSGIEHASTAAALDPAIGLNNELNFEYRSRAKLGGWPMLHVAFGKDEATGRLKRAHGIIAIGNVATGFVSLGIFAQGVVAWGIFSIGFFSSGVLTVGLLSMGVLSVALFASYGVCAVAPFAFGVTALGYIASGVAAWGVHSASATGSVDVHAAALSDRWLPLLTKISAWIQATGMTTYMLTAAFGAWKVSNKWLVAMFLGLSLLGPLNFVISPSSGNSFASRLRQQLGTKEQEAKKKTSEARRQRINRIQGLWAEWVAQASRTDSAEVRDRALKNIHEAIQSDDPDRVDAGLIAVSKLDQVRVDKTLLRNAIRQHLDNANTMTCGYAINALLSTNYEREDEQRLLAMVPVCNQRLLSPLGWAVATFSKRDYTGQYSTPMLSILERAMAAAQTRDGEGNLFDSLDTFNPLWGGKFSPQIEARVIEWTHLDEDAQGLMRASNSSRGYNAFYYALSVQANKSTASVKRLLELAQHPDATNIAGRCLWGMRGTVPVKADQVVVAQTVIKLLESRSDGYQWRQGLELLVSYAAPENLPALQALAAREALPQGQKETLNKIIAQLNANP